MMQAAEQLKPVPPVPAGPTRWIISPFEHREHWCFRCPAPSPRNLLGPFVGCGGCLGAFMPEHRTMRWFDPSIAAHDGDIVLVELTDELIAELLHVNRDNPEWLAKYGPEPPKLATKWLRHYRGELYIFEEKTGVPLAGRATVLAVCTYALVDGRPVYGSGPADDGWSELAPLICGEINLGEASGSVDTSRIDLNAATEVLYAFDDGPLSDTSPTIEPGFKSFTVKVIALDVANATDVVFVSVSGRMEVTGDGTESVTAGVFASLVGASDQKADSFIVEENGEYNFSMSGSFTSLPVDTHAFGLNVSLLGNPPDTTTATFRDVNVTVALFKR